VTSSYDEVIARLYPRYTFPLSTLLTQEEANLMGHSIMGSLFAHVTEVRPNGILMLFKDREVQAWGEERIAVLRSFTPAPEGPHCERCGRTDVKLGEWGDEEFCRKCRRIIDREYEAYIELEKGLKGVVEQHISRWHRGGSLRRLLGIDGNTVKNLVHQICLDLLRDDLYGKQK